MKLGMLDAVNGNVFEEWLYLEGISEKLGYKRYEILSSQNKTFTLDQAAPKPSSYALTALKIISYCTVIIPVIALCGKLYFRSDKTFAAPKPITIGSYNILFPQPIPMKKYPTNIGYSENAYGQPYDNIDFRIKIIKKNILESDLDIICVQEITQQVNDELIKSLGNKYTLFGCPHTSTPDDHGVGVFYKTNRFKLLQQRRSQLNLSVPTPAKNLLKQRVHVVLDLQDKLDAKICRVASVHMVDPRDWSGAAKKTHADEVVKFINAPSPHKIHRTVIAGDMNQDEFGDIGSTKPSKPGVGHATSFAPFIQTGFSADNNLDSSEFEKANPDNGPIYSKNRRIDWIFAKGSTPVHLPLAKFDIRGSDHRLVAATIH